MKILSVLYLPPGVKNIPQKLQKFSKEFGGKINECAYFKQNTIEIEFNINNFTVVRKNNFILLSSQVLYEDTLPGTLFPRAESREIINSKKSM